MFCFSVMESSFCFANVEFITVTATSFLDELGPLRSVQAIFVWKKGFQDAACVLETDFHCKIKETDPGLMMKSKRDQP